jgi:hypothetical protein
MPNPYLARKTSGGTLNLATLCPAQSHRAFNRERALEALKELRVRAEHMNSDPASPFRVTELIAFGDILDEHSKVQTADVAVALSPKESDQAMPATAVEHKREEHVLAYGPGLRKHPRQEPPP